MERTISPEERIRRAEEIYSRRKSNSQVSYPEMRKEKKDYSLLKKMALQILICMAIYVIFYLIKNTSYFFSDDVINRTKEILKYDINFQNIYAQAITMLEENKNKIPFLNGLLNVNDENSQENLENNIMDNENQNKTNEQNNLQNVNNNQNSNGNEAINASGVGGGKEENTQADEKSSTKKTEKSQMEIDAEYLKTNYKFTIPIKGTITSRYGKRTPTNIVSENHYGIDIAANIGTEIISSIDGIVEQVSSEGEYGIHVKIRNREAVTLYAHCSKILVKEKDNVKQGQKIALVGNTGKTTGPHLHFEIRRDNKIIDPEYILSF